MEFEKYFEEAKKRNITPYQISHGISKDSSVSTLNGVVEDQKIGISQDISAKGLLNGKLGSFSTDAIDELTPSILADGVLESALYGKEGKKENFFAGGLEYKKADIIDDNFKEATLKDLRELALELSKIVKEKESGITNIMVSIGETDVFVEKTNDLGLYCTEKSKCFYGGIEIVAEDDDKEPRTSAEDFKSFISIEDLKIEGLKVIDKLISGAVDFFKSKPCKSTNCKVVFSPDCISTFLGYYTSHLDAKMIHNHLSLLEDKLGKKVVSDKLSIEHTPHIRSLSSSSFDSDGYPTQDFNIIKNGVLNNICYCVESANEDKTKSNGCACGNGNASVITLSVEKGKKSLDELFKEAGDGIYINQISGISTGMNTQTLQFSLPCQGYLIKNGKKDKAVSMIVCSGNINDLLSNVIDLANDVKDTDGCFTPSILFSNIAISGE